MTRFVVLAAPAAALSLLHAASGCAPLSKLAYAPGELRAEVLRRARDIKPDEVVVPFELGSSYTARAQAVIRHSGTDEDRMRALARALFDPAAFGLRYGPRATASAQEALRFSEGNCLAVASIFIGLARSVGLRAYYIDASIRLQEGRYGEAEIAVSTGHITAVVRVDAGDLALDIERIGPITRYRIIDDLEALAHFYNNRGFDRIEGQQEPARAAGWNGAARDFHLAVEVKPTFAPGWNNLGLAAARLGRYAEAIDDYRTASRLDPDLVAPLNNLGALYLQTGRPDAALEVLEAAASLDPRAYHIRYNLAEARLRRGDRHGAIQALREAIDLHNGYAMAQELLNKLTVDPLTERPN